MSVQDIIAIVLALVAAAYVARFIQKTMTGRKSCGSACGSTGGKSDPASDAMQLKRVPLVTLDPIGKPLDSESRSSDKSDNVT